ncbi:MAG: hypothetical protein JWP14_3394 [Frankiales bacterium]|nr:hypothetical protein [Frankiales bacterium]
MRTTQVTGRWEAATVDYGQHVHVLPLADTVAHQENDEGDCVCGPHTHPIERKDGSIGWLIVHSSLDGRELTEP